MLYRFGEEWILTRGRDITLREKRFLEGKQYTCFLSSYIVAWSAPVQINQVTVSRLDSSVAFLIIDDAMAEIRHFNDVIVSNFPKVVNVFKLLFSGHKIAEREEMLFEYLDDVIEIAPFCFDHRGNLIHLPKQGGVEDQPYEKLIILSAAQKALREILERQMKG